MNRWRRAAAPALLIVAACSKHRPVTHAPDSGHPIHPAVRSVHAPVPPTCAATEAGCWPTTQAPQWIALVDTPAFDYGNAVAVDVFGNAYLAGSTGGQTGSAASFGGYDAFVAKYSPDGAQQWIRQFGSGGSDSVLGAATDVPGNIALTGLSGAYLPGVGHTAGTDIFVVKMNAQGEELWRRGYGRNGNDAGEAVAFDSDGSVYVSGFASGIKGGVEVPAEPDIIIIKYDGTGDRLWAKQLVFPGDDISRGIALDSQRNIYIAGSTTGSFGESAPAKSGRHALVAKFDPNGNKLWSKIDDHEESEAVGIAIDHAGNIDVAGTAGSDIFAEQFDANGKQVWRKGMGTNDPLEAFAIAVDANGKIYLTGHRGVTSASNDAGAGSAVVIRSYSQSGATEGFRELFGMWLEPETSYAAGQSIAVTPQGQLFIAGTVPPGDFQGNVIAAGHTAAFLAHFCADGDFSCADQNSNR